MKDSKRKSKSLLPLVERKTDKHFYSRTEYGIIHRGKLLGGIKDPQLYTLEGAQEFLKEVRNTKAVKIRITHEVIAEVVL